MSSTFTLSATFASSAVSAMAYQEQSQALALTLANGLTYLYSGVPRAVAGGLAASESAGRFYNESIRGKYLCTKVGNTTHQEPSPALAVAA